MNPAEIEIKNKKFAHAVLIVNILIFALYTTLFFYFSNIRKSFPEIIGIVFWLIHCMLLVGAGLVDFTISIFRKRKIRLAFISTAGIIFVLGLITFWI